MDESSPGRRHAERGSGTRVGLLLPSLRFTSRRLEVRFRWSTSNRRNDLFQRADFEIASDETRSEHPEFRSEPDLFGPFFSRFSFRCCHLVAPNRRLLGGEQVHSTRRVLQSCSTLAHTVSRHFEGYELWAL